MARPVAGSRTVVLVLIAVGAAALLFAACVVQPAPTPNVEELAQALARTWATQTAQAAPSAGAASVATIPASVTPAPTLPAAEPTWTLPATRAANGSATPAPTGAPSVVATRRPTSLPTPAPSATPTAVSTSRPTPTPSVTPTLGCAIPVDAELVALWDRAILGCPGMRAQVIPASWQQFEHGYILWKSDQECTLVLAFANETDPWQGTVIVDNPGWQWDGISFPNGRGLTPPPGLLEPVGRLGFVWYEKLGGPSSQLGWATAPAQELCITAQPASGGVVAKTNPRPCSGVKNQSLEPLFIRIRADGNWQRRPETQPPTRTPTATPQCAIATDSRLASAWERRERAAPSQARA